MQLYCKHYPGPGQALIILHGLYGNQGNWSSQARVLAQDFDVHVLDARNHGQSPWMDTMSLADMAADVADTMAALGLAQAHLLGHSMGGKTAMLLALLQPALVQSLCVVDIAPVDYERADDGVLRALNALDLTALASRAEADAALAASIASKAVRDFLLANLQRDAGGGWRWRFNLAVLTRAYSSVTGWPQELGKYLGPTLFIKGEQSNYILPVHAETISHQFPLSELQTIAAAGHWVHSERPAEVVGLLRDFLQTVP